MSIPEKEASEARKTNTLSCSPRKTKKNPKLPKIKKMYNFDAKNGNTKWIYLYILDYQQLDD